MSFRQNALEHQRHHLDDGFSARGGGLLLEFGRLFAHPAHELNHGHRHGIWRHRAQVSSKVLARTRWAASAWSVLVRQAGLHHVVAGDRLNQHGAAAGSSRLARWRAPVALPPCPCLPWAMPGPWAARVGAQVAQCPHARASGPSCRWCCPYLESRPPAMLLPVDGLSQRATRPGALCAQVGLHHHALFVVQRIQRLVLGLQQLGQHVGSNTACRSGARSSLSQPTADQQLAAGFRAQDVLAGEFWPSELLGAFAYRIENAAHGPITASAMREATILFSTTSSSTKSQGHLGLLACCLRHRGSGAFQRLCHAPATAWAQTWRWSRVSAASIAPILHFARRGWACCSRMPAAALVEL